MKIWKRLGAVLLAAGITVGTLLAPQTGMEAQAKVGGKTVIVIDPGHGGANELGAVYAPFTESAMTLYVAGLMAQELQQYDNVIVLSTRTADTYLSLADRVEYAKNANADFLFSVHFNVQGGSHDKNGAIILQSAFDNAYVTGSSFGLLELQQLAAIGIQNQGFWTRLGNDGQDYYGIIRRARAYGIPAVITEHCYIDNPIDRAWLSQPGSYQKLAHADVTALAQYLHLKSTKLGVDYSAYPIPQIPAPPAGVPVLMKSLNDAS